MKGSLQDQLLKAGLVSKEQQKAAKQHKKQKAKMKKQAKHGNKHAAEELSFEEQQKIQAQKALEERRARDQKLNQEREESKKKRAIVAAIQQLVNQHKVNIPADADLAYHFQHDKKVKKIWVDETTQTQLARGKLAIVPLAEHYYLIPLEVGKRIEERAPGRVIFIEAETKDIPEEDDPYAGYEIPDDLMW